MHYYVVESASRLVRGTKSCVLIGYPRRQGGLILLLKFSRIGSARSSLFDQI